MEKIYTYPECIGPLEEFHRWYGRPALLLAQDGVANRLKDRQDRLCRYCGKREPDTTFKNDAHVVSQLLGKNNLLCDEECDACNRIFSKYESSFVNWLGITRTLVGTKNRRNKVPEYFSGTGSVQAKTNTILEADGTLISRTPEADDAININMESGKTTIQYLKRPYIPMEVYKVLLKIAFSALPADGVAEYTPVLRMLTIDPHSDLCRFAHVMRFQLPLDQTALFPYGILFTKHDPAAKCPKHCFVFYYANQVYSFPLPFSIQDIRNGCYQNLNSFFPPPLFFEKPPANSRISIDLLPMGSLEKVKDDREAVTFEFDPKDLENVMAFDPATGESKPHTFDPKDIISLFMVEKGKELRLPRSDSPPAD